MAAGNRRITTGVTIWWRNQNVGIWLELGKKRADSFITGSAIAVLYLMLLPQPWGTIATIVAGAKLKEVKRNKGPNGLWLKLKIGGLDTARPRTAANMHKEPNPW